MTLEVCRQDLMNKAAAAGTPLVLLWPSVSAPLLARKKRFFEALFSDAPSPLRWCAVGTPLLVVRKSERTTSPLERYDFKTIPSPSHLRSPFAVPDMQKLQFIFSFVLTQALFLNLKTQKPKPFRKMPMPTFHPQPMRGVSI